MILDFAWDLRSWLIGCDHYEHMTTFYFGPLCLHCYRSK